MNSQEYLDKLNDIGNHYDTEINNLINFTNSRKKGLNNEFIVHNAKFKMGDFVWHDWTIIKVEKIEVELRWSTKKPEIVYLGYRYKKNKGTISKVKTRNKYLTRVYQDRAKKETFEQFKLVE